MAQWRALGIASLLALAPAAAAQVTFTPIAAPAGSLGIDARGASDDCSVIGGSFFGPGPIRPFRWTQAGGLELLDLVPGQQRDHQVSSVSGDGRVVSGYLYGSVTGPPFIHRVGSGTQFLGPPGGYPDASLLDTNGDGSVTVGALAESTLTGHAVRWVNGVAEPLDMPNSIWARASAVSADGSVVAGSFAHLEGGARPFRWTPQTGAVEIPSPGAGCNVGGMSGDGQVFAGLMSQIPGVEGNRLYRWTEQEGVELLPTFGDISFVEDVSWDGSAIVGQYRIGSAVQRPFVWTEDAGLIDVTSFLLASGIDLTGWELRSARAISADGLTIVGNGRFEYAPSLFRSDSWIVTIPGPGTAITVVAGALALSRRRRSSEIRV